MAISETRLYYTVYCTVYSRSNVTPVVGKFSTCACLLTKANIDLIQVTSDEFRSRTGSILTSLFNG